MLIWNVDPTKILMRHELAAVLGDLNSRAIRSGQAHLNRAILRLACCCGLRVSEIGGLRLADICLAGPRPHVRIRACNAKGGRSRRVPLWWDAGTLADLVAWRGERVAQGGRDADPFISSVQAHRRGQSLQRYALRRRFLTACKILGRDAAFWCIDLLPPKKVNGASQNFLSANRRQNWGHTT